MNIHNPNIKNQPFLVFLSVLFFSFHYLLSFFIEDTGNATEKLLNLLNSRSRLFIRGCGPPRTWSARSTARGGGRLAG